MLVHRLTRLAIMAVCAIVTPIVFGQTNTKNTEDSNFERYFGTYKPTNNFILAEIGELLVNNKLDSILIDRLTEAIQKEPENMVFHYTLGKVYDSLFQHSFKTNDPKEAELQFQLALQHYTKAIELKKENIDNIDALHAAGQLYYTKASLLLYQINETSSSLPAFERRQLEKDYLACYSNALPYFSKLESLKPNDPGILSILREIYFHKNELVLAEEFVLRLKVLQEGGRNERPYF